MRDHIARLLLEKEVDKVIKDAQGIEGERRGGPQREFFEACGDLQRETAFRLQLAKEADKDMLDKDLVDEVKKQTEGRRGGPQSEFCGACSVLLRETQPGCCS